MLWQITFDEVDGKIHNLVIKTEKAEARYDLDSFPAKMLESVVRVVKNDLLKMEAEIS